MTKTFTELVKLATFDAVTPVTTGEAVPEGASKEEASGAIGDEEAKASTPPLPKVFQKPSPHHGRMIDSMTYRIEIILPANRDKAVYDAIFRSLKEHLL